MVRFTVVAISCLLVASAAHGGLSMEFVAEDIRMATCFPLAGYLRIANETSSPISATGCYKRTCEGFDVVIVAPGGERITPWKINPDLSILRYQGSYQFPAFSELRVPVFLFRFKGEYVFSEPGDYEVAFTVANLNLNVTTKVTVEGGGEEIVGSVFDPPRFTNIVEPFMLSMGRIEVYTANLGNTIGGDLLLQLLRDYHEDSYPFVMGVLSGGSHLFGSRGMGGYDPDTQQRIQFELERNRQYNTGMWRYVKSVATVGPGHNNGVIYATGAADWMWTGR